MDVLFENNTNEEINYKLIEKVISEALRYEGVNDNTENMHNLSIGETCPGNFTASRPYFRRPVSRRLQYLSVRVVTQPSLVLGIVRNVTGHMCVRIISTSI